MTDKDLSIKQLEKAFDGDLDLMLFYLAWVKNGRNATKAYMELNPEIEYASAAVLGCRLLKKVNLEAVLQAYNLTEETYYTQLVDGLKADKRDQFSGEMSPDHKTRKDYHDKLGKLLGIEHEGASTLQQFNLKGDIGITYIIQTTKDEKEFIDATSEPVKDIPKPETK